MFNEASNLLATAVAIILIVPAFVLMWPAFVLMWLAILVITFSTGIATDALEEVNSTLNRVMNKYYE